MHFTSQSCRLRECSSASSTKALTRHSAAVARVSRSHYLGFLHLKLCNKKGDPVTIWGCHLVLQSSQHMVSECPSLCSGTTTHEETPAGTMDKISVPSRARRASTVAGAPNLPLSTGATCEAAVAPMHVVLGAGALIRTPLFNKKRTTLHYDHYLIYTKPS